MMPRRIQRKRSKGWKMPANTKCVTRPGRFGNPFYVAPSPEDRNPRDPFWRKTAEAAVADFERLVIYDQRLKEVIRTELRGFNLACYCAPGKPCHADILLKIANGF